MIVAMSIVSDKGDEKMKVLVGKKVRLMAGVVAVTVLCSQAGFSVYGSSVEDLKQNIQELEQTQDQLNQQKKDAESQQNSMEDQLESTQNEVTALEQQKKALEETVKQLDIQLGAAVEELETVTQQQQQKQDEIDQATIQLEKAKEAENLQYANMKLRIQYMYETMNESYLAVLFSASSATDLLNRAEYISNIYNYDRMMLQKYEQAKNEVESQKQVLTTEYAQLEQLRGQAQEKQTSVEALLTQKNEEVAKQNQLIAQTKSLAEQYQEQIAYQDQVIAQLEAKVLEAVKQQEQALSDLNDMVKQTENAGSVSGVFVWPCPSSTRITSEYGYRIHPIYGDQRFHNGIDIGASMGAQILATCAGTVIGAGYNSSMGNYVMLDHGSGLVSIYMHASVLKVSSGDHVETGEVIALVGSTGNSTGPHLHFTMRLNGSYVSPWDYVSI